jgi:hypothetical protein
MDSDLREAEDHPLSASVHDEARQAAERRVAWYFGDLLDNVTTEYPVARHRLVTVLGTLETAAETHEGLVEERSEEVGYETTPGTVYRTPRQVWAVFEETAALSDAEARAVRAVHRRMAVALVGDEPDPAAPFFVRAAGPGR